MKKIISFGVSLFAIILFFIILNMGISEASDALIPLLPAEGSITYSIHPHFSWQRESDVKIDDEHRIQIAKDEAFTNVVCEDKLKVVSRFVPVNPLEYGKYWWRVSRVDGEWSKANSFEVVKPTNEYIVPLGSDADTVESIISSAALNSPALVKFEPGDYTLAPKDGKTVVKFEDTKDLIIDGQGSNITLTGTLLNITASERVTIRNFNIRTDRPGHTLVKVLKKDLDNNQIFVKAEPGYDPDVLYYFNKNVSAGCFLSVMDQQYHGKFKRGAYVSGNAAEAKPIDGEKGVYSIGPISATVLANIDVNEVAVVTQYRKSWVSLVRTNECTFSRITLTNVTGALCDGTNNSAKSYLECKVKLNSPTDYFGGHTSVENGYIGIWAENCEFEGLADDGLAMQSFRMMVKQTEGINSLILKESWTNRELRSGYIVSIVNSKTAKAIRTKIRNASPGTTNMQLDFEQSISELAKELGINSEEDWVDVHVYPDSSSNVDTVYRHNSVVGARGHAFKFNGTRAWVSENFFKNTNGNAIYSGYISSVSGHGAWDVLIEGNKVENCGWYSIYSQSTSKLGGNIIIRNNSVNEVRDIGIFADGVSNVTIKDNEITSSTTPTSGAWIIAEKCNDVKCEGNRYPPDMLGAVEFKTNRDVINVRIGGGGKNIKFDQNPVIVNDRVLVPIRAVIEALGGTVSWDEDEQKATIVRNYRKVEVWINKKELRANGIMKEIDVPAILVNNRTLMPIRAIVENIGIKIDWDNDNKYVTITQ